MTNPPIEPDAWDDVRPHPDIVSISVAISLKRIADSLASIAACQMVSNPDPDWVDAVLSGLK